MASVTLKNIYKIYSGGVTAVTDFNLDIADKEFIILVGPSGCGKSTTLRMIAGLEEISKGELYIGDVLSNDIAPKDRDIAMVFPVSYTHLDVYKRQVQGRVQGENRFRFPLRPQGAAHGRRQGRVPFLG